MNKPLLLCLFMIFWGQCFAQSTIYKSYNEAKSSELINQNERRLPLETGKVKSAPLKSSQKEAATNTGIQNTSNFPDYWPDRVFIKLKNGQDGKMKTFASKAKRPKMAAGDKLNNTLQRHKALSVHELPKTQKSVFHRNTFEAVLETSGELQTLMQELKALPEVEYVERVPYYVTFNSPNDPNFLNNNQYAINITKATEAYSIHTGSTKTLLAIVDDAVLVSHPDLSANINIAKSYDVADKDSDPRPPSSGPNKAGVGTFSHGTHCAGIAGAVTDNGMGIASISNNKVSIIGVKCTRDNAPSSRAIEYSTEGIIYAINQGARVISMSFGGSGYSRTVQNIINDATANGVVFVAAAGNNNTESKMYPAAYDNVISVASTDANDLKSSFSTYGTWVDIAAPGSGILSTVTASDGTSGAYTYYNGTSMACPMVASLVAYMLSENPNLTPQAITQLLKETADPLENVPNQSPSLAGKLGSGRINAFRAIQAIKGITNTVAPSAITDLKVTNTGYLDLTIEWSAPNAGGAAASLYDIRYSTSPITAQNFDAATKTKQNVFPGNPGTSQQIKIQNLEPGTTYYIAMVAKSFYGNASPVSNVASTSTLPSPKLEVNPSSYSLNLDRSTTTTVSRSFSLTNTGQAAAVYSSAVMPVSGNNVLAYDKQQLTADNSIGLGGDSFISATKFIADARGFNLTHVQNFINNSTTADNAAIGIRVLKGGTNPANATLVTSQISNVVVPAGGGLLSFPLHTPQQFAPGEVFWIVFVLPTGLDYPQGIDNAGPNPGTFFLSTGNDNVYEDAQTLASFLANASFKIRAANASWITLSPANGTLEPSLSTEMNVAFNASDVPDGVYQMNLLFNSNDVFNPKISRPVTLNVTGGQPKFVMEPSEINFGTLFVGASRTLKIRIANTGTATLNLKADGVNLGTIAPSDFTISTQGPFTLAPGKQQEISVSFTPSKKEALNGTLTLSSNDPTALTRTVPIRATLVAPPVASINPKSLDFELDYSGSKKQIQELRIENKGEADLTYTLQPQLDPLASISYDANRQPDNYLGYGSQNPYIHTALKFDVKAATFNLTHVQNYFRTQSTGSKTITLKVYKGGNTPTAGTLLLQQTFEASASATNGSLITIPLQQPQQFKEGDVFWVMFYYNGVNQPQGYNINTPNAGRNFYSSNGTNWFALESAGDIYASSTFIIKALEMPQWLSVSPENGTVAAGVFSENKVVVNADGLKKGRYKGKIQVLTNDPNQPLTTVEVNMQLEENPVPDFSAKLTEVLPGEEVSFLNTSKNADTYTWQFEGTETTSSTLESPTVVYSKPGKYKVTLTASNSQTGRSSEPSVKENFIIVSNTVCQDLNYPIAENTILATNQDGYLTGNNKAGDLAKANYFTYNRPEAYVTGLKVKFGAAVSANPDATIKIAVWETNTSDGKPHAMIAFKEVALTQIAADVVANRTTEVVFDAPVRVKGNFVAGILLNTDAGNSVAIEHGTKTGESFATAWTQDNQSNWKPFREVWPELGNEALRIQPSITHTLSPISGNFTLSAEKICEGEQVQFDASSFVNAVRYEWSLEGSSISSSTDIKPTITYLTPGTHKVVLKAYDACSGVVVITKTITVVELPDANITASGSTTFCEGEKITLSAPVGEGYSYRWSNGATTRSIEVSTAGNYTVTVTNESGCASASSAMEVKVNPLPVANITVNGSTTFCHGDQVVLTASEGSSYLWSNGATSRSITVTAKGTYTVQVMNSNGCSAVSEEVNTTVNALPAKPIISRKDVILTSEAKTGNQWFLNNSVISGATENVYEATEPGTYQLQVMNENGCVSELSEMITIEETDLVTGVKVYPNPSNGIFTIGFTGLKPEKVSIRLLDAMGKVVYAQEKNSLHNREVQVDVSSIASGIYLLQLRYNEQSHIHRIVIQH